MDGKINVKLKNTIKVNLNNGTTIIASNNHNDLRNLDYENSGHIGFASSEDIKLIKEEIKNIKNDNDTNTTYTFEGKENGFIVKSSDGQNQEVEITPKIQNATIFEDGLMSSDDKTKLEHIEENANKTIVDKDMSTESKNPLQNSTITRELNKKVDKEEGKSLSSNDFTNYYKDKLDNLGELGENNIIEKIKLNGTELPIYNKAINIPVEQEIKESDNPISSKAVKKSINDINENLKDYILSEEKGKQNGVATLGNDSKIVSSQLPDYLLGQVLYGGNINSSFVATITNNLKLKLGVNTSTITLSNTAENQMLGNTTLYGWVANQGVYFIVQEELDFANIKFLVGDWLISTGTKWDKIDNTDAVSSVNGKTGVVNIGIEDIQGLSTEINNVKESAKNKVDSKEGYSLVPDNEIQKLATVEENANYYVLPNEVVKDAHYVHTDNNFSDIDKNKLDSIEEGAEANVQSNWTDNDSTSDSYILNKPTKLSDFENDLIDNDTTYTFRSGDNSFYVSPKDGEEQQVYVNPQIPLSTPYQNGLMSSGDKNKLDTIEENAQKNVQSNWLTEDENNDSYIANKPTKLSQFENDLEMGNGTTYTFADGYNSFYVTPKDGETQQVKVTPSIPIASETEAGLMSSEDRKKLKDIELGGQKNVQSNWLEQDETSDAFIRNKPTIPTVWDGQLIMTTDGDNEIVFSANSKENVRVNLKHPKNISYFNNDTGYITINDNAFKNKVDQVTGKQLSTNDFTNEDKDKLSKIQDEATKVESSTTNGNIKINGTETNVYTLPNNVVQDSAYVHTDNNYTTTEKNKLTSIQEGATKVEDSSTNGNILINGIETNVYTLPTDVIHDSNYVHTDNNYTTTDKTKLDGIDNNAKKVEKSDVNGNIKISGNEVNVYTLPSDVPHDSNYVHTDNNYTNDEKNKLASVEQGANKVLVDDKMSDTSTNPVQNKVIVDELKNYLGVIDCEELPPLKVTDTNGNVINNPDLDTKKLYRIPDVKDYSLGTTVPNTGFVGKVYVNTSLSDEEVKSIINKYCPVDEENSLEETYILSINNDLTCIELYLYSDYVRDYNDNFIGISQSIYYYVEHYDNNTGELISESSSCLWCNNISAEDSGLTPGWQNFTNPIEINTEVRDRYDGDEEPTIGIYNDQLTSLFSTTPFTKIKEETNYFRKKDDKWVKVLEDTLVIDVNELPPVKIAGSNGEPILNPIIDTKKLYRVPDITDLTKGTPVPNTGTVEKVYLNTDLTVDEVKAIINSVPKTDWVDSVWGVGKDLNIVRNVDGSYTNAIYITDNGSGQLLIYAPNLVWTSVNLTDEQGKLIQAGWQTFTNPIELNMEVSSSINGKPSGTYNSQLSSLFSLTEIKNVGRIDAGYKYYKYNLAKGKFELFGAVTNTSSGGSSGTIDDSNLAKLDGVNTFQSFNTFNYSVRFNGKIIDSLVEAGKDGQVLTSTSTGVKWSDSVAKAYPELELSDSIENHNTGVLSISKNEYNSICSQGGFILKNDKGFSPALHIKTSGINDYFCTTKYNYYDGQFQEYVYFIIIKYSTLSYDIVSKQVIGYPKITVNRNLVNGISGNVTQSLLDSIINAGGVIINASDFVNTTFLFLETFTYDSDEYIVLEATKTYTIHDSIEGYYLFIMTINKTTLKYESHRKFNNVFEDYYKDRISEIGQYCIISNAQPGDNLTIRDRNPSFKIKISGDENNRVYSPITYTDENAYYTCIDEDEGRTYYLRINWTYDRLLEKGYFDNVVSNKNLTSLPNINPEVPNVGTIEHLYFNTSLTNEEILNLTSELTWLDGASLGTPGIYFYPIAMLTATEDNISITVLLVLLKSEGNIGISLINPGTMEEVNTIYWSESGWNANNSGLAFAMQLSPDFMGMPIGLENQKISSMVSTEPIKHFSLQQLYRMPNFKEGTTLPNTGLIDKICFNTYLAKEDVEKITNELTWYNASYIGQSGFEFYPILGYINGSYPYVLALKKYTEEIDSHEVGDINGALINFATMETIQDFYVSGRWEKFNNPYLIGFESLSELSGIPIGTQNEKIKSLISLTPMSIVRYDYYQMKNGKMKPFNKWAIEKSGIVTSGTTTNPNHIEVPINNGEQIELYIDTGVKDETSQLFDGVYVGITNQFSFPFTPLQTVKVEIKQIENTYFISMSGQAYDIINAKTYYAYKSIVIDDFDGKILISNFSKTQNYNWYCLKK